MCVCVCVCVLAVGLHCVAHPICVCWRLSAFVVDKCSVHCLTTCTPLIPVRSCYLAHTYTHTHTPFPPPPNRSLGCVFYELTAQRPTFNAFNIHGLVSKIKKNKLAPLPSTYSAEWRDVVAL